MDMRLHVLPGSILIEHAVLGIALQQFSQIRIIDQLGDAQLFRITLQIFLQIDHQVGEDPDIALF